MRFTHAQSNKHAFAAFWESVHGRGMKTNTTAGVWTLRRSDERGRGSHGWLESRHSFSFADYYDPAHMGFRSLRVINEDHVAPHGGFPEHPHRDMEIFSYVVSGELAHGDSMGNRRTLKPGEVQLMSAGRGVTHSEFNPSATEAAHFLQIWILPRERGLEPRYTDWKPAQGAGHGKLLLISPDGRDGSATIAQDAEVHRLRLEAGQVIRHDLAAGRGAWVQVVHGSLAADGVALHAGDGASTERAGSHEFTAGPDGAEALLFDLA